MKKFAVKSLRVLLPVVFVAASIYGASILIATAPQTQRVEEKRLPPMVEALPVAATGIDRIVSGLGTVIPAQQVTLSTEISGGVLRIHPELQPGGLVKKGELLLKINPEEYELAVSRAEAALQEAKAALEVEQGRQRVAEREWELFGKSLPDAEMGRELMLRGPQLNQAKARIASAQSDLEQAKLNLKRTEVFAPFDAVVLEEAVDLGQQIDPGHQAAVLAGTDEFWITAKVLAGQLAPLLETQREKPSVAKIYSDVGGQRVPTAEGRLVRHLGQVDPEGRMAQVLIAVPDPLALSKEPGAVPLPLNTFVRVELDAGRLEDAVVIPRDAMHENNELWVVDEHSQLQFRTGEELWRQQELVALRNTFEPGDRLIVSPLDDALPGMDLRVRGEQLPLDEQRATPVVPAKDS